MNPIALQAHISESFCQLVTNCVCTPERLQNMRFKDVFDTGLWISSSAHFTVIYTSVSSELKDCLFQIGAHGREARQITKKVFKGKYSDDLTFDELNEALKLISEELENN